MCMTSLVYNSCIGTITRCVGVFPFQKRRKKDENGLMFIVSMWSIVDCSIYWFMIMQPAPHKTLAAAGLLLLVHRQTVLY